MTAKPIIRAHTSQRATCHTQNTHTNRALLCVRECVADWNLHIIPFFHTKHRTVEQQHRGKTRDRSEQHKCRLKSAGHSQIHMHAYIQCLCQCLCLRKRIMLFFIFFSSFLRLLTAAQRNACPSVFLLVVVPLPSRPCTQSYGKTANQRRFCTAIII